MRRIPPFLGLSILGFLGVAVLLEAPQEPRDQTGQAASPTFELYCGLWRVDSGFSSTIRIKNSLTVAPIEVDPVFSWRMAQSMTFHRSNSPHQGLQALM